MIKFCFLFTSGRVDGSTDAEYSREERAERMSHEAWLKIIRTASL
jgi:hypothetical protein